MNDNRFTENARSAMNLAAEAAYRLSHNYIGTEHLLLGLIEADGVASKVLTENGVEEERVIDLVNQLIAPNGVSTMEAGSFTPRAKRIIEQSFREAMRLKAQAAGTEHILIALLKEGDCIAVRLLNTLGINIQKLYMDTLAATGADMGTAKNEYASGKSARARGRSQTPTLDQYSRDLTEYARKEDWIR